jgi:hypothetical protein
MVHGGWSARDDRQTWLQRYRLWAYDYMHAFVLHICPPWTIGVRALARRSSRTVSSSPINLQDKSFSGIQPRFFALVRLTGSSVCSSDSLCVTTGHLMSVVYEPLRYRSGVGRMAMIVDSRGISRGLSPVHAPCKPVFIQSQTKVTIQGTWEENDLNGMFQLNNEGDNIFHDCYLPDVPLRTLCSVKVPFLDLHVVSRNHVQMFLASGFLIDKSRDDLAFSGI